MYAPTPSHRRRRQLTWQAAVACSSVVLLSTATTPITQANPEDPVIKVEEDWELVLNVPKESVTSPQFHTVMSPYGDLDSVYMQAVWNYRETPYFVSGGMQLQAYDGDYQVSRRSYREDPLSSVAETIAWTQSLETDGTKLTFTILNGQSTTWGSFGGSGVKLDYYGSVPNLDGYSTDVSAEESWLTFGANRADLLKIKQVRKYRASGAVEVDNTQRILFGSE